MKGMKMDHAKPKANSEPIKPILVPPQGRRTIPVFGMMVDLLLSGEDTQGVFSTYRISVDPESGPPLHVHRTNDETFYVLDGHFEVQAGDIIKRVAAGTYVFLPRDIPHSFRNVGTTTGTLLGISTPPGHERFFEEIGELSALPKPEDLMEICRKHGLEIMPL
jgi:mannose-6-phosphate isomerase-like protein (cupin superfamily)